MTSLIIGGKDEGITGLHVAAVVFAAAAAPSYATSRLWFVEPKIYVVDILKTSYGRCRKGIINQILGIIKASK